MMANVPKANEADLRITHPMTGLVEGWFFRCEEVSAGRYVAEGRDLWGRSVSRTGAEGSGILEACVADARAIIEQFQK
jgi:hypothetical protein